MEIQKTQFSNKGKKLIKFICNDFIDNSSITLREDLAKIDFNKKAFLL